MFGCDQVVSAPRRARSGHVCPDCSSPLPPYTLPYRHTYKRPYTHTHIRTCTNAHRHMQIIYILVYITEYNTHTHIHPCYTHAYTHAHMRIHSCTHAYTHTSTHKHNHTHTHTHTLGHPSTCQYICRTVSILNITVYRIYIYIYIIDERPHIYMIFQ